MRILGLVVLFIVLQSKLVAGQPEWMSPLPDFPVAATETVSGVAAAYMVGSDAGVYVIGGTNYTGLLGSPANEKEFYPNVFRFTGNEWELSGRLRQPLAHGVAVAWEDGFVYIGGEGRKGSQTDVDLYRFYPGELPVIESLSSLPEPMDRMAVAVAGPMVYIAGGRANGIASNKLYCMNLDNPDPGWQLVSVFPGEPRIQPVMVAVERFGRTHLYLWGGYAVAADGSTVCVMPDGLLYDTELDSWTSLAPPKDKKGRIISLTGGTMSVWNKTQLIVTGGVDEVLLLHSLLGDNSYGELIFQSNEHSSHKPAFHPKMLVYDIEEKKWKEVLTNRAFARAGAAAAVVNDELLLFQGEEKPGSCTSQSYRMNLKEIKQLKSGVKHK